MDRLNNSNGFLKEFEKNNSPQKSGSGSGGSSHSVKIFVKTFYIHG